LSHPDVQIHRDQILKLVKKSFDGFKSKALADYDEEHKEEYDKTKKVSRRQQRQRHTFRQRYNAADEYSERNGGLNVVEALHADFISDYASGPETESEETYEQWKVRMGRKLGMDQRRMGAKAWSCTRFLEHIKPNWRSEKVSRDMSQYRS
jgi:hypothetical protein